MAEQVKRTVAMMWEEFSDAVFDKNLTYPTRQVQEMKRAFYGGASAAFFLMTAGLDGGTDATEADIAHVDGIYKELEQFKDDMASGRA